jgi:hypothetical protein
MATPTRAGPYLPGHEATPARTEPARFCLRAPRSRA